MPDGMSIPASRLAENDGIVYGGVRYRVIRVYEPMFKTGLEITCMSDYASGIVKFDIENPGELIQVLDLGTK